MWRHQDPKCYPHSVRADAAAIEMARQAQYYQHHAQTQPPVHRRTRHRSTGPGAVVQQYGYPPEPAAYGRPREPAVSVEANAVINAVCALTPHEAQNLDWLLDLEFGPPLSRQPTNRHVAYYDAGKRIVMSASQPNTVHPDFLRCNERFRGMLVEQYARREPAPVASQGPVSYQDLYRMMEEQKQMQSALVAATRQAYHRHN